MESINHAAMHHVPWNKGKLVGQKAPLKQREIWAIRIRLQLQQDARELALFNLAIDSKLRSCDLVSCESATFAKAGAWPSGAEYRATEHGADDELCDGADDDFRHRSCDAQPDRQEGG